jgi:predicted transcriptional regulator
VRTKDFWLSHEIGGIPIELQKDIGVLMHSEIIASDQANILRCHEHFLETLKQANEIYGVSPIIAPGYSEAIRQAVERGVDVELVLTEEVLGIASQMNPDLGSTLHNSDNFKLYRLKDQVTVAFTVTDSMLSLGFYRFDGCYDIERDLIGTSDEARVWGMRLFEYYRQKAEPVRMPD